MPATRVSASLTIGGETAVHAMYSTFEAEDTNFAPLVDASNEFNSLNRAVTVHNTRILCPSVSTCAINTYSEPMILFVMVGKERTSAEGITQGDPFMSLYAIGLQPLITRLNSSRLIKQFWYADDATCAGPLRELRKWWDVLSEMGLIA